jgi:hypothetical protein
VVILAKLSKPFMDGEFVKKSVLPKTATFKAISLFANTLDDCISDMAGDIHCQHKKHIKKLRHI